MTWSAILLIAAGLASLIGGAELLVRGASRLAAGWKISPLIIGLTVVAYGTSTPELAVSLKAASTGQAHLALGNVVGSNIFNVLFILGISALVTPLRVSVQLVRGDVWIMVATSAALLLMAIDGTIGRFDGLVLTAGIVLYTWRVLRTGRMEAAAEPAPLPADAGNEVSRSHRSRLRNAGLALAGLFLLFIGADWLIDGALLIGRALGISDLILGLTVVAAGTSLPEVATSVVASFRGQRDIAVGNVVGSNIFNILAVLGFSAALSPRAIAVPESASQFDIPVMVAAAFACLPIFFTGYRIDRWEGGLFLGYYVAYVVYLILDATRAEALKIYSSSMLIFVIPLTALTLLILTLRSMREPRQAP